MIKNKMVGLIACVDITGLLSYNGVIPWVNTVDLKRFRTLTLGTTLVMGRTTYESLPPNKLPGRIKHVLSSNARNYKQSLEIEWFDSILPAIEAAATDMVWIAGGAAVYKEALLLNIPDFIDLSIINGITFPPIKDSLSVQIEKTVKMPQINYTYQVASEIANPEDPKLFHRKYIIRPEWQWKEKL